MTEIRTLTGLGWEELAAVFNAAFSDYVVPMSLAPEALEAMQRRRGYAAEASFGAFEAGRLVGFVFTCLEEGRAYNSGTGVVPGRRGTGLARRLVDAVIADAAGRGARSYALEVIETNEPAAALYRKAGFAETRRLQVWSFAREAIERAAERVGPADDPDIVELAAPALDALAADCDTALPWQNSLASIRRASVPPLVLGNADGAAVVFPASGDLPLLCVRRAAQRRGLGLRLLRAAAARADRPLRTMVDDGNAGLAAFLEAAGGTRYVRQLEMIRPLP